LPGLICDSYEASSGVHGSPRVFGDLREAGQTCGKHHVAQLMRQNKIKAVRGYKAPHPIVKRPSTNAPNRLDRQFTVDVPDKAWVAEERAAAKIDCVQLRDLRAKAGTDKAESSGDVRAAQRQLGHTSVVMTEHYIRARRGAKTTPTK
jgi:integrase